MVCAIAAAYHLAMKALVIALSKLRLWRDARAQDLTEYVLLGGFMAVAAGAVMPNVVGSISTIFSRITSVLTLAISPAG
jgi:pilus assembly protein Flp/PilA